MARINLTSSIQPFPKQGSLLTPTYSALTGYTGIQWSNSGREVLAIINGATASNWTVNIGTTVQGQAVSAFTGACPVSNTAPVFIGPFPSIDNQNDGLNSIYLDFSSVATVTVALLQMPGVF